MSNFAASNSIIMYSDKKIIILDLGGVLLDINIELSFGALVAMGLDAAILTERDCLMNETILKFDRGDISADEFYSYIENSLPENVRMLQADELRERVCEIWNMMLGSYAVAKINRIKELRSCGYRVLLLSNTNEGHWDEIERRLYRTAGCYMNELFDSLYLSYKMHTRKPESDIFLELMRCEGVEPGECIFFDDSQENCDAASKVGIEAVKVERNMAWDTLPLLGK